MSAQLLSFPSAEEARQIAQERLTQRLVAVVMDLVTGNCLPANDKEQRMLNLVNRMVQRSNELKGMRE
jgi:hypothetical protein